MEDELDELTKSAMLDKETKYSRLNIALSSATTTVRVYHKDITMAEMDIVNDNPAIHCMVLENESDMIKAETKLKVKEEENSKNFDIFFINQDFIESFADMMSYTLDTSNILQKEDVVNEPTKILAG